MSVRLIRRLLVTALALSCFVPACKSHSAPEESSTPAPTTATASAVASGEVVAKPAAAVKAPVLPDGSDTAPLTFSRDNIAAVLGAAKSAGKLVFIDAGAEWCHTCLSMEAYVLTDRRLGEFASKMLFVALDTDKVANAEFLARFKMHAWPTYFVIEPADGQLIGLWPGAASVAEMYEFLQQSVAAAEALDKGTQSPALKSLVEARAAHAAGDYKQAVAAYERALAAAPTAGSQLSEVLLGYSRSLQQLERYDDCAALAVSHLDYVTGAARPIEFANRAFSCFQRTKRDDRPEQVKRIVEKMRDIAYASGEVMSADDRADALDIYADALSATRDRKAAQEARAQRLRVLDEAAAAAKDPQQARAFDRLRALSFVSLGREQEAFEFLRARQRQFPLSYEPPAILADVYMQLGNGPEALKALTQAVALAEGKRKFTLIAKTVTIHEKLADKAGQRAALKLEIAERKKLPHAAADAQALRRAEAALVRLGP